ncbi:hypothetical protein QCA50_000717 [Cerrena zonata]|uniref:Ribosomal RNA-processing protein 43 n=1 Tax=Cerrena zonata TaxID=2478898 RepID=A0AAW0GS55_9APHY
MAEASSSSSSIEAAEQEALKVSTFRRLHPRVYLERFLAERVRPDGRELDELRDVTVNVGSISTADGSALVRLGETTIICGVKAEISEPELDHPHEGFLVPNLDLPAICSPKFKPGPPTEEAQVLSDRLNDVLLSSGIITPMSLCIEPGKSVWVLYVDAICINYDGNAFDAALLAMVAALRDTRLPKATYNEETGRTTCSRKELLPLQVNKIPVSSSFGVFDSTHVLADPTTFEEPLLDTTFTITVDEDGKLVSILQLGLGVVGQTGTLEECIATAKTRASEVKALVYSSTNTA